MKDAEMNKQENSKEQKKGRYGFLIPVALIFIAIIIIISHDYMKDHGILSLRRNYPVMGTFAGITLYGKIDRTEKAAEKIYRAFKKVEKTCSIFDPQSELSKLNASAHEKPFKCSPLLWELIMLSKNAYEMSGGAFDITAKPLMDLWGFYRKREKLPDQEEIKKAMEKVGFDKLILNEKEHSVKFKKAGVQLDMGGIAKGFAVDKAAKAAIKCGVKMGIINLGGNMRCLPLPPPGKEKYTIGIRDPINKDTECAYVELLNSSVATSGNYERYLVIDGVRYTHIMDVKTGRPVKDMLSVTVVTPLAANADIFSTSIFIKGEKLASKICSAVPATNALIIKHPPGNAEKIDIIKTGKIWGDVRLEQKKGKKE